MTSSFVATRKTTLAGFYIPLALFFFKLLAPHSISSLRN